MAKYATLEDAIIDLYINVKLRSSSEVPLVSQILDKGVRTGDLQGGGHQAQIAQSIYRYRESPFPPPQLQAESLPSRNEAGGHGTGVRANAAECGGGVAQPCPSTSLRCQRIGGAAAEDPH